MILLAILAIACGTDHWAEKTLTDQGAASALAPAPRQATIEALGKLPKTARRRTYIVEGTITNAKKEADGDLHVVITDAVVFENVPGLLNVRMVIPAPGSHSMIVELPDPRCSQTSLAIAAIRRARVIGTRLRVGQRVRVVGMLFLDHLHGQSGAAPNGAELHPVFRITKGETTDG